MNKTNLLIISVGIMAFCLGGALGWRLFYEYIADSGYDSGDSIQDCRPLYICPTIICRCSCPCEERDIHEATATPTPTTVPASPTFVATPTGYSRNTPTQIPADTDAPEITNTTIPPTMVEPTDMPPEPPTPTPAPPESTPTPDIVEPTDTPQIPTLLPTELVNPTDVPTEECKPGWGHGDDNHCHDGPPGQDKK